MAVFFGMPDNDCVNLLARAMRDWHPALTRLGVKVQVIMAASDNDTPAVKHGGYAALATIRIVPLKDRLTKQYDAESLVSRHDWENLSEEQRLALFDHLLSRVDPVKKEIKQCKGYKGPKQYYTPLDDLGRPKLKLRLGDWSAGDGFAAVVHRHGDNAIEFENLRRAALLAERAKSGAWTPDDQGGEITETVDRHDIGTQLTFDDIEGITVEVAGAVVSSAAEAAERIREMIGKPKSAEEDTAPAYEVGGPREPAVLLTVPTTAEVLADPDSFQAQVAAVPTWRKMPLAETGWEETLHPSVWAALTIKCWTAGELADELLRGEKFGLVELELNDVYGLVEQISGNDESPVKFPGAEPEISTGPAKPVAGTKLSTLDGFPDAVADKLLPDGISTVETLIERMEAGTAYIAEMPLRNNLVTFLVLEGAKLRAAEFAADAVANHLAPKPEQPAQAIIRCEKCKATYDATGREKCPSCGLGIDTASKPTRFTVEQGEDGNDPPRPKWDVVDTKAKEPSDRYRDEYPTEAQARAEADRLEAESKKDATEPAPASAKAALKAARAAGKPFKFTSKPTKKPKAVKK